MDILFDSTRGIDNIHVAFLTRRSCRLSTLAPHRLCLFKRRPPCVLLKDDSLQRSNLRPSFRPLNQGHERIALSCVESVGGDRIIRRLETATGDSINANEPGTQGRVPDRAVLHARHLKVLLF